MMKIMNGEGHEVQSPPARQQSVQTEEELMQYVVSLELLVYNYSISRQCVLCCGVGWNHHRSHVLVCASYLLNRIQNKASLCFLSFQSHPQNKVPALPQQPPPTHPRSSFNRKILDGEISPEDAESGNVKVSSSAWRKQKGKVSAHEADMEEKIMNGLIPEASPDTGAPEEHLDEEKAFQNIMDGGN